MTASKTIRMWFSGVWKNAYWLDFNFFFSWLKLRPHGLIKTGLSSENDVEWMEGALCARQTCLWRNLKTEHYAGHNEPDEVKQNSKWSACFVICILIVIDNHLYHKQTTDRAKKKTKSLLLLDEIEMIQILHLLFWNCLLFCYQNLANEQWTQNPAEAHGRVFVVVL